MDLKKMDMENNYTIKQPELNSEISGISEFVFIEDENPTNTPQSSHTPYYGTFSNKEDFCRNNLYTPHTPYCGTFLYIPRNLDLKGLIEENGRKQRFYFHYAYIISTIYMRRFTDRRHTKNTYVPINTDIARTIISKRKCKEIISDLIEWGVIECDYTRVYGFKSYGYRFPNKPQSTNSPYYGTFHRVKVEDKLITRKMNNFKEKQREEAIAAGADYEHLFNSIHKIKIDYARAMEYINENYVPFSDDYESRKIGIELIHGGDIFFKVDKKGNRAHTNLTNLASDLRQFIRYEGKKLGQVDLRNSQPFLLNMVIKKKINFKIQEEEDEYKLFKHLTESGEFYEYMMDAFGIESDSRKEFKVLFFGRVFFDRNREVLKKEEEEFKKLFPTIFRIIRAIKKDDYTQLAISLQRSESKLIINECVRKIRREKPDMFLSTIHDSLVGELKNLDYFRDVIEEVFLKYNLEPTVKKEKF